MWFGVQSTRPVLVLDNTLGGAGALGKVGVNTEAPLSTFDVNGSVGFQYTNVAGVVGGSTVVGAADEYTFRIDLSGFAAGQRHTMELPLISGIDRRIYYFKATAATGASANAELALEPNVVDQIENFTPGGGGRLLAVGLPLILSPGSAVTIIANGSDGAWWVI